MLKAISRTSYFSTYPFTMSIIYSIKKVDDVIKNCRTLHLALLFSVFGVPAPGQTTDGYRIRGEIKGLVDGSRVYLISGFKRIDSTIVKGERFSIHGVLNEPEFTYLYTGSGESSKKLADILLDNREVTVTGTKADYDHINVSGSEIDQQWKNWYNRDQQLGRRRFQLEQIYQSLLKKDNKSDAASLKKIIDEMTVERIALLKSYVKQHHDSPVGAVLPTLCTLQDQLTQADFMEMYDILTPSMKSTKMAQETKELARKTKSSIK